MPRYRFAWDNLPPSLLAQLCEAMGLDGEPAEALRASYGARPKEVFVQEMWSILLDAWLAADDDARTSIVELLQDHGLGDRSIDTATPSGQVSYLRSCRNSKTLREVVLAHFHFLGEGSQVVLPVMDPAHEERSGRLGETGANNPPEEQRNLEDWVLHTLSTSLGVPHLDRAPDGDVVIRRGSSIVFVRVEDNDAPFVHVFAPLLSGFTLTPAVYEAVNTINTQIPLGKAMIVNGGETIVLAADVAAQTLSPEELLFALDMVSQAADHYDTRLQKRFGGATAFEDDEDTVDV